MTRLPTHLPQVNHGRWERIGKTLRDSSGVLAIRTSGHFVASHSPHFNPSFFLAASRVIDSRIRFSLVSDRFAK